MRLWTKHRAPKWGLLPPHGIWCYSPEVLLLCSFSRASRDSWSSVAVLSVRPATNTLHLLYLWVNDQLGSKLTEIKGRVIPLTCMCCEPGGNSLCNLGHKTVSWERNSQLDTPLADKSWRLREIMNSKSFVWEGKRLHLNACCSKPFK